MKKIDYAMQDLGFKMDSLTHRDERILPLQKSITINNPVSNTYMYIHVRIPYSGLFSRHEIFAVFEE